MAVVSSKHQQQKECQLNNGECTTDKLCVAKLTHSLSLSKTRENTVWDNSKPLAAVHEIALCQDMERLHQKGVFHSTMAPDGVQNLLLFLK